jgi:hypothetical protein
MWYRVAIVKTNVSQERIASVIRATRIGELEIRTVLRLLLTLFLVRRFLSPWWWMWYIHPKRRFLQEPHGVKSKKTVVMSFFNNIVPILVWTRCRSVGMGTGYNVDDPGFDSQQEIFLYSTASRSALEPTRPHIQGVPGALSYEIERPVREGDRGQEWWSYASTALYVFMAQCLIS